MALSSRKQGQQQTKGTTYVEVPIHENGSTNTADKGNTLVEQNGDNMKNEETTVSVNKKEQQQQQQQQQQQWKAVDMQETENDGLSPMDVEMGDKTSEDESIAYRHWRNSSYAVRCIPPTWEDEIQTRRNALVTSGESSRNICTHACHHHNIDDNQSMCCCLILSGYLCGSQYINAKRLGNMVVLKEELEEEVGGGMLTDEEDSPKKKNNTTRSRVVWMLGPYWPFLFCVTYPLVYGISFLTLIVAIPKQHSSILLLWVLCTGALFYNLFNVSCRDPGILRRHSEPPANHGWRWHEETMSYIPRGAVYDPDCGCVIEEYDHVCPWTGTAIGKRNMPAFQGFVAMILLCMVLDILLLTGALE